MRCLSHDDQWHRSIVESWRNEKAADHYNSLKRVGSLFLSVVVGHRFSSVFLKRKKVSLSFSDLFVEFQYKNAFENDLTLIRTRFTAAGQFWCQIND